MMTKIQNLISVSDVSGVKVIENGEKLVSLNGVRPDLLTANQVKKIMVLADRYLHLLDFRPIYS